jgi:uncharacterized NAD(P)/FAD-binding protein YdhS
MAVPTPLARFSSPSRRCHRLVTPTAPHDDPTAARFIATSATRESEVSAESKSLQARAWNAGAAQRSRRPIRTILVVGAGFCGTSVATQLLHARHSGSLRIVLVDGCQIGRGVAYRQLRYPYLLNVRAAGMSADAAHPLQFLEFARRQDPGVGPDDYLPRALYGDYLESLLRDAERACPPNLELQRVYGQVIALEWSRRSDAYEVHLADGRVVSADGVVLALGNPAPRALPVDERLKSSACYVHDPWQAPPHFRPGETVLVAGTGLTMADVVLAGHPGGRHRAMIHAVSRHGLLPRLQAAPRPVLGHGSASLLQVVPPSAASLCARVRELAAEASARGGDWREAVVIARELAPQLWQRMSDPERRRFLRHVRPYWDSHRHRLPASVFNRLEELRGDGQLQVQAARILGIEPAGGRTCVHLRPRGTDELQELLVDRVVNCTGPDYDIRNSRDRLIRSLTAQGLVSADPGGLGLRTGEHGAVVDASGVSSRRLFYIGPQLRPTYWESSAVAELRQHAARLARHLAAARSETESMAAPPPPSWRHWPQAVDHRSFAPVP